MVDVYGGWQNPDWSKAERVHDWRNYVSPKLQELWPRLSDEVKEAIAEQADEDAGQEEWE